MKRQRIWGFLPAICLLSCPLLAQAPAYELRLGAGVGTFGGLAEVPLTLSAPAADIQGLVASFEWDAADGTGESLEAGAALATADTVSTRVEAGYMALGVVMDSDGVGGEFIPAGTGLDVATVGIRCAGVEGVFPIAFVDGKYALAGDEPKLSNILVEGGISIGVGEGLALVDGSFECDPAMAELALSLGSASAAVGNVAAVPLTLTAPISDIQGLVAVFEWDAARGAAESLTPGAAIADADTVAMRVDVGSNFMALGVVMDSDGQGGEVIAPGTDLDIATAGIRCGDQEGVFEVRFVDGAHAMVGASPALDNIVVEGGLSIGVSQGLTLTHGSVECAATGEPDSLVIEGGANDPNAATDPECGDVRVLMTNFTNVEGYVTAICHDPAVLSLSAIEPGAAATANGADFTQEDLLPDGGTLGVVLDLFSPFDGNVIPPGTDQHIATYRYCCVAPPAAGAPDVVTPLTFCDGTLGVPTKDNVLVIGGLSRGVSDGLVLVDGEFTCKALPEPADEICDNGLDDDGDELIDCADPDCFDDLVSCPPDQAQMFACGSDELGPDGRPLPIQAALGADVDVCFYIKSPEDGAPGHAQFDHIQGFSMALTFCCDLVADDTFDVSGTIVEAIGAEFVTAQADNSEDDGDGCELVLGVLVDALPPFDGATIPPFDAFQRVGCVTFSVKETATCGECCTIAFTDGVNGTGKVPVKNLISVENQSRSPQLMDCEICIVAEPTFYRGDCNFSGEDMGMAVNIADAAASVSFLFLPGTWKFEPPCLDACDCNDDGRIDLADVICVLQYALQNGRFPPAPGPGLEVTGEANPNAVRPSAPGVDPTDDKLDCDAGVGCP